MSSGDEEPVDPFPAITEACKPKCTPQFASYKACIERIEKKKEGDCEAWYFDYYNCLDKCVTCSPDFQTLEIGNNTY
eukprot:gene8155-16764_t